LTAGTRRNGTSKLGPFNRVATGRKVPLSKAGSGQRGDEGHRGYDSPAVLDAQDAFAGRHAFEGHDAFEGDDVFEGHRTPRGYRQEPWRPQQSWQDSGSRHDTGSWQETAAWQAPEPWEATGAWPAQPYEGLLDPHDRDGRTKEHRSPGTSGRHAGSPGKPARKRAGQVVPAVAVAATLAVGAAAYTLFGTGGSSPQAAPLNAAQGPSAAAVATGAGQPNGAAGSILKIATASGPGSSRAATHAPAATPSAKPSTSAPAAPAAPVVAPTPQATSASPAATKAAAGSAGSASSGKTATLSCNLSGGLLPDNVSAIVSFLLAHGYSDNAAAGIAGNIYQESKGNPESEGLGGGGLIGWTPLPAGFVTGNVTADLNTQLAQILVYNQGWAQFLPALESASSPAAAADIYVTDFERAGIPAASTRETAAADVASACGI
jgi:hypothetical protein